PVERSFREFKPLFDDTDSSPPSMEITETATMLVRPDKLEEYLTAFGAEYTIQNSPEVRSGPQGTLFGEPLVNIGSPGNPDYFEGHTAATATLMKIEWTNLPDRFLELFFFGKRDQDAAPEEVDDIVEASFDFTYFGDEVLEVSPLFDWDPLIGYGNVANWGMFDGQEFATFADYAEGWQQYQEQLIRFWFHGQEEDQTGYLYIGWVAPSIPDGMGVTLSYSENPTLDDMFAQHVPIDGVKGELTFDFDLGSDFADGGLTYGDIDQSYRDSALAFTNEFAQPAETGEPPPPDSSASSSTTSSSTTSTTLGATAISAGDDPDATDDESAGWFTFQSLLWFVLAPIALIILLLMVIKFGKQRGGHDIAPVREKDLDGLAGPPDDFDGMAGSGYDENHKTTSDRDTSPTSSYVGAGASSYEEWVLATHLRDYGGNDPVDGWIAPAYGAVERWVGKDEDRTADAWSETFFNVESGNLLRRGDDGFDELMEKLNIPKPPEWEDPMGMDTGMPTN
ncbi:MAG: hypothetical protein DWP92_08850, partial [Armatimonadetes bacterium]